MPALLPRVVDGETGRNRRLRRRRLGEKVFVLSSESAGRVSGLLGGKVWVELLYHGRYLTGAYLIE